MHTKDPFLASLEVKPFFNALSYRDFLTPISLSVFIMALIKTFEFVGLDDYWDLSYTMILIAFLFMPINHIVYRLEHKRQNNYMGRVIHDITFILLLIVIMQIHYFILTSGFMLMDSSFSFVILIFIILMGYELLIALLKRLLNLFSWQIL